MTGYVEIIPGWDAENSFAVMDWSASGDSGWCAAVFDRRDLAIQFAQRFAVQNARELHEAEIIAFPIGGVS